MEKPVVGVIGLGAMGAPIAQRLIERGHRVLGYDIDPTAQSKLIAMRGEALDAIGSVASKADIVLVVLVDDGQVEQACVVPNGIFATARRDAITVVMSSVSPDLCIDLARRAREHGQHLIDAPMVRGEAAAVAGKLLLMIGGPHDIVERCMPVFACFASDHVHLGEVGAGQVGKMVNNMLLWAAVVASHEGLQFARRLGVDIGVLRESLKISSGDNWALRAWDTITAQPKWWDQKDLSGMLSTAEHREIPLPLTQELLSLMAPLRPEIARKLFAV